MPAEKNLEKRVRKRLRELGKEQWHTKIHGDEFTEVGTPDILGVIRGCMIAIELKAPGETPAKIQLWQLARLKEAGAETIWVDNYADFDLWLSQLLDRLPRPTGTLGA